MKQAGVYEIRNMINQKCYIGSSFDLSGRLQYHRHALCKSKHFNPHLQNAYNKYGKDAFLFVKLLYCDSDMILVYEQICFDELCPEYNVAQIAGNTAGCVYSEETKKKMSKSAKAQMTSKMRLRISRSLMGRVMPESIRQKISRAHKGKKNSAEHNRNIGKAVKRRTVTDETRKNMSKAQKRRFATIPITEEFRQSRRNAANIRWAREQGAS